MATVIDALIVELSLDPAKYQKGLSEALTAAAKGKESLGRDAKDIEARTKSTSEAFGKLRTGLLGVAALFTAGLGMKEFIQQTVQTDMGIGRLSQVVGVSAKTLSTWRTAGLLAGGSAESFTTTLRTITLELAKFQLTGESQIIPMFRSLGVNVTDSAGKFKNATTLLLETADAIAQHKVDPARATIILQSMGADEATIAAVYKGRAALQAYLTQAERVGGVTDEDVKAAGALNTAWNELAASSSNLGRTILTDLTPFLVNVLGSASKLAQLTANPSKIWDFFFAPNAWKPATAGEASGTSAGGAGGAFTSQGEKEAFIRAEAAKRGISPDVAMAVAKSEGFGGYTGDRGSSFGAFQLHYGGVAGGGMGVSGLGDKFTAQTGLDARDKSTEREQIKFALDEAQRQGWSPWHGWRGAPFAGIGTAATVGASAGAPGGNHSTSDVKIGTINVVTQATDAKGIARDTRDAMTAAMANTGQW